MLRSRVRPALALAAVFVVMGLFSPAALAAKAARLSGYDVLVTTGGRATLRFKVERRNLIRWDLSGVTVEFSVGQQVLGRAVSANDGYADLVVNVGPGAGDLTVTGRIPAGGKYSAPAATLLVAVRERSARVVITDIDWTLASASWTDVLFKRNADIRPVRGSISGVNDLAKDATVVYVTARDDGFGAKTKSWLAHWGFPRGPVFFSDDARTMVDPRPYKSSEIRFLKAMFPNMPCGFGDLKTDAQAYDDNGLTSYIFDTHRAGPYPSYAIVTADWDALRAQCAAGQRPELSWAGSFK